MVQPHTGITLNIANITFDLNYNNSLLPYGLTFSLVNSHFIQHKQPCVMLKNKVILLLPYFVFSCLSIIHRLNTKSLTGSIAH